MTTAHSAATLEPCAGCGALFPPHDGPTHPYIGASAACWAVYVALNAGCEPEETLLATSRVGSTPEAGAPRKDLGDLLPLLVDAYAVQHPGDASAPAVQSVAVHLLALHGVLQGGFPVSRALWLRRRALRARGGFHELRPPEPGAMFTLRHLFPGGGVAFPVSVGTYVETVHAQWAAANAATLAAWYERLLRED